MERSAVKAAPGGMGHGPAQEPAHNHAACLQVARENAKNAFYGKRLRLTPLRAQVFDEIASTHHAIGAYGLIERLREKGRRLAPVSVYRALDALLTAGVVHRLESRNAYFACHSPHGPDRSSVIMVCGRCDIVGETPALAVWRALEDSMRAEGFAFEASFIEVSGVCAACLARANPVNAQPDEPGKSSADAS